MKKLSLYVKENGICEFEPFNSWKENYIYWLKKYFDEKFKSLLSRFVEDENKKKMDQAIKRISTCYDIEEFKDEINTLSRIGFKSPKSYFIALYKFYYFLDEVEAESLKQINQSVLTGFANKFNLENEKLVSINARPISIVTIENTLIRVKNFLKYIEEHNVIAGGEDSFSFKLKSDLKDLLPKNTLKTDIVVLSPDKEYIEFLKGIDEYTFKNEDAKFKLALKILATTGMRVSELTNLKKENVFEDRKSISFEILGKGNKKRTVFIEKNDVKYAWERYKRDTRDFTNNSKNLLFVNSKGTKLNDRTVGYKVEEILKFKQIKTSKKSAHLLRHSVSTYMFYNRTHSIEEIQAFLGHENLSTTQIYIHIADKYSRETSLKLSKQIKNDMRKRN